MNQLAPQVEPKADELRQIAAMWDDSAAFCRKEGWPELAKRDERIAYALRFVAEKLGQ
jgi:hypothetical protein